MNAEFLALAAGCLLAIVTALAVVLARRPVHAVVGLLAHSLSLAGLFAILGAGLVAVGQLIIYSGAIVVLFLFVVTLLPTEGNVMSLAGSRVIAAVVAAGALLVAFVAAFAGAVPAGVAASPGSVADVGRALFGPIIVAFELTAPLLLVAIVGAVAVWRRHEPAARPAKPPEAPAERHLVMHR